VTEDPRPTRHDQPPPPGVDRGLWAARSAALSPNAQAATEAAERWQAGDDTVVYAWLQPDGTFRLNPDYREVP
jgi:hypothetical protein